MALRDQTTDLERAAAAEDSALVERVEREAANTFGVLSVEAREALHAVAARLARYRDALALIANDLADGQTASAHLTAADALAVVRLVTVDGWQFCVLTDNGDQYVAARCIAGTCVRGEHEWQPVVRIPFYRWSAKQLRAIADLIDPIERAVDAENAAYRRAKEAA